MIFYLRVTIIISCDAYILRYPQNINDEYLNTVKQVDKNIRAYEKHESGLIAIILNNESFHVVNCDLALVISVEYSGV